MDAHTSQVGVACSGKAAQPVAHPDATLRLLQGHGTSACLSAPFDMLQEKGGGGMLEPYNFTEEGVLHHTYSLPWCPALVSPHG